MARAGVKQETTTVTRPIDDDDDAISEAIWSEAPLFATSGQKLKRIATVAVHRSEPDSGYLGWMQPDVSEASLVSKWGGGTYKLEAKNSLGQVVPGGIRTLKLAGDPIFSSQIEEKRWRRANGLNDRDTDAGQLSTKDLLTLMEERDEKRRAEQLDREERARAEIAARDERERVARDERAAQALREADDRKARELKDADEREERRRREAREDDERRSRIHREDMERITSQNAQQLANTQQMFTQLATTLKTESHAPADSGGAVMKALLTGIQVAREIAGAAGGGDKDAAPADAFTSLIQRLPETLREVRQTGAAVFGELAGKKPAAAAPPGPGGKRRPTDHLTITGPTATKAKRVLNALAAAGRNPEAEMDRLLDFAASQIPGGAAPPAAPAAASSSGVDRTTQPRARGRVRTKQARRPPRRAPARPAAAARRRKGAA